MAGNHPYSANVEEALDRPILQSSLRSSPIEL
jgi:hypothetical protein